MAEKHRRCHRMSPQKVVCIGIPLISGFYFSTWFQGFPGWGDLLPKSPRIARPLRFWSIVEATAFKRKKTAEKKPSVLVAVPKWGEGGAGDAELRLPRISISEDWDLSRWSQPKGPILGGFVGGFLATLVPCRRTTPCGRWCWCGVTACLAIETWIGANGNCS